jgi:hypothetical protein
MRKISGFVLGGLLAAATVSGALAAPVARAPSIVTAQSNTSAVQMIRDWRHHGHRWHSRWYRSWHRPGWHRY